MRHRDTNLGDALIMGAMDCKSKSTCKDLSLGVGEKSEKDGVDDAGHNAQHGEDDVEH